MQKITPKVVAMAVYSVVSLPTLQKYHIANAVVKHSALNFQAFRHFFPNAEAFASKRLGVSKAPFPVLNPQYSVIF